MPRRRLGVAVLLPEPVSTEIRGLRRALGTPSTETQPPHITLVPPVNVRSDRLLEAGDALRAAAAQSGALRLTFGPVATFAPVSPVVYLAVGGDVAELAALRSALLVAPLERRIDRPFVPHVTLHEDADPPLLSGAPAVLGAYSAEFHVDRIHLLEQGQDLVWRPIYDAALARPVVRGRGGVELAFSMREPVDMADQASVVVLEARSPSRELVGSLVATTTGTDASRRYRVLRLFVTPAWRRQGVSGRLLAELQARVEVEPAQP